MELISLQGKSNFFEKRVSDYSKSGVNQSTGDGKVHDAKAAKTFTLEEDF